MTTKLDDTLLTQEDRARIVATALKLFDVALEGCGHDALHALGALLFAAGTAAAWGKLDYSQMITLVSTYYEGQLLKETERELRDADPAALVMPKAQGSN